MQSGFPARRARNRLDPRVMPGGFEEFDQSLPRNRRRPSIYQGMKVEHVVRHHGGVEHHRHTAGRVVDGRERGHRAGLDAEQFAHQLGRAEREPSGRAQEPVQRLQFDHRVFERHHQEGGALFVAQEQVLGVPAGHGTAQFARLVDGEDRRMADGLVGDAQRIQVGEKVVRRGRH
jgi:hypothetical protein